MGAPLPCNGRGHDHKVGLVELPGGLAGVAGELWAAVTPPRADGQYECNVM